jgi:hypothetical protein
MFFDEASFGLQLLKNLVTLDNIGGGALSASSFTSWVMCSWGMPHVCPWVAKTVFHVFTR